MRVGGKQNQVAQSAATCPFSYPEDGGDTFLRNVGSHKIYTVPHPRRRNSSEPGLISTAVSTSNPA
jgi:hypothetical protein